MRIRSNKYGHHYTKSFINWLKATLFCRGNHNWFDLGDPCYCGSDNCSRCKCCGVEVHD